MKSAVSARLAAALVLVASGALAQQGDGTAVGIQTSIVKPDRAELTDEHLRALVAPPGFRVEVLATGLQNTRILAVAPNGDIYVSRRDQGDMLLLRDADADGTLDQPIYVVATRPSVHGLAIHEGRMYMATAREVFVADILANGLLGEPEMIVGDLPDGGQHPNRTMVFGPDGMMYLSIGSSCNACNESNPEHATMLRVSPDGKQRSIFAGGLRNTIGFGFEPATGELWGMDHGIDLLGDDVQLEELNRIRRGKQYGWPHVFEVDSENPQSNPPGRITKEQWKAMSEPMVMGYTAHAAPMQMVFYTGTAFPAEYQGDAFVAMRGSWNRNPPSGYEIVRIRFENGEPTAIVPFVTGFLTQDGRHIARPVGMAMGADGSLLMSEDANGTIYRIRYTGDEPRAAAPLAAPPAGPVVAQTTQGTGVPLALERPELRAQAVRALQVSSASFGEGGTIPRKHSEYADGVSPELRWSAAPGAQSYVVVMEDPDARPAAPFVHWVGYNIPAGVTRLPEGLQEQLRLTEPDGLLQGRNSHGSPGYYGPRPPLGDAPHRYVFQVMALDTMLDVPPGAERDQVLAAAQGHVIAAGRLIGRYAQQVEPPK